MGMATHFLSIGIFYPGDKRQTDGFDAPLDFPIPREGEFVSIPETKHNYDNGDEFKVPASMYRVLRVVHHWPYLDRELGDREGLPNTSVRLYVEDVESIDPDTVQ